MNEIGSRFENFEIIGVNNIIGLYEHDKDLNYFDECGETVKKFRKFKVELKLKSKECLEKWCNVPNYDIGKLYQQIKNSDKHRSVDIIPIFKGDDLYFKVRDKGIISIDRFIMVLDDFYKWKDGKNIIKDKIQDINIIDENIKNNNWQEFYEYFASHQVFDYSKFIKGIEFDGIKGNF